MAGFHGKAAGAATDERDAAGETVGRQRAARIRGRGSAAGPCERAAAARRDDGRAGRRGVADAPVVGCHAERSDARERVVERRDADGVAADAGRGGGVETVAPFVAGRRHHDHPALRQAVRRLRRWIVRPLIRCADADVEDVGAVLVCAFHRRQHHLRRRRAGAAEDAVGEQVDLRRDTRDHAVRADDAGDVGAVTVAIIGQRIGHRDRAVAGRIAVRIEGVADEIPALRHPAVDPEAAAEIGMVVVEAGIDHGDTDPATGEPPSLLEPFDAGRRPGGGERAFRLPPGIGLCAPRRDNRVHGAHARHRPQGIGTVGICLDRQAVPQIAEVARLAIGDAGPRGREMEALRFGIELCESGAVRGRRADELDEPGLRRVAWQLHDTGRRRSGLTDERGGGAQQGCGRRNQASSHVGGLAFARGSARILVAGR